jgi:hypothetical protein
MNETTWARYSNNPFIWLVLSDEEKADAVWRIIKSRETGK